MLDLNNPRVFETALDSLGVGGYLVDRHRKIVYWNRGAERISGYLRQDVTGRFCRDDILVHSDENRRISVIVQYMVKDAGLSPKS